MLHVEIVAICKSAGSRSEGPEKARLWCVVLDITAGFGAPKRAGVPDALQGTLEVDKGTKIKSVVVPISMGGGLSP